MDLFYWATPALCLALCVALVLLLVGHRVHVSWLSKELWSRSHGVHEQRASSRNRELKGLRLAVAALKTDVARKERAMVDGWNVEMSLRDRLVQAEHAAYLKDEHIDEIKARHRAEMAKALERVSFLEGQPQLPLVLFTGEQAGPV